MHASTWVGLLPIIAGIISFRKSEYGLKSIFLVMIVSFISDMLQTKYGTSKTFALFAPRIYTLLEFLGISIFFYSVSNRLWLKRVILILMLPFCVVVVLDLLMEGLMRRDDLSVGIESLIFIGYAVISLFHILKDARYLRLTQTAQFWVIAAVLIYFGGSSFVFVSYNYVADLSAKGATILWGVHAVLAISFTLLLTNGLWKAKEPQ